MSKLPRHWQPLVEIGTDDFQPERPEIVAETMKFYKISEDEARALLQKEHDAARYFVNSLYQVQAADLDDGITHLNIRRRDGSMFKDWRHFQQIKNEICGPEREGIELYPAESRLVDTSNKWHLWVLPEGVRVPVGWQRRDVQYDEDHRDVPGMRQRPL